MKDYHRRNGILYANIAGPFSTSQSCIESANSFRRGFRGRESELLELRDYRGLWFFRVAKRVRLETK